MIDLKNIEWLGHSSFRIRGRDLIYIDPWEVSNPVPADIILITHGHSDHCSESTIATLLKNDTVIVGPAGCSSKLGGRSVLMKPGDKRLVRDTFVEAVPAYNTDKPFHPRDDGGLGYIVTIGGTRIYHAGDTDLIPEMSRIRADIVLLPVSGIYVMGPEEAAKAADLIKAGVAIPMHYGSIVGSDDDARRFAELANCRVEILRKKEKMS